MIFRNMSLYPSPTECGTILNAKKEDDGEQNPMVQTNHETWRVSSQDGHYETIFGSRSMDMKCRNGVKILIQIGNNLVFFLK